MQDAQHLERVRLEFQMFEIQKSELKDKDKELVSIHKFYSLQQNLMLVFSYASLRSNCTDGYLKIFLKGQETQDAYDKFDYELCGMDLPTPKIVVSDGPRLAMVFSSGELQARGFKVFDGVFYRIFLVSSNISMCTTHTHTGQIHVRNRI